MTIATPETTVRFPEFDPERRYGMVIGSDLVSSVTDRWFRCVDPYEDREWGYVPDASAEDVDLAVRAAAAAFPAWAAMPASKRLEHLRAWAQLLREEAPALGRTQVHENGKTLREMTMASASLAQTAEFCGNYALTMHGVTVQPYVPGHDAWTVREPLGVIAAITPWNNPLGLLQWKLFPALATGNTIVIKPSEVTPVSTLRIAELALEAGFPPGVINVVTGAGEAGAALVAHPGIAKVGFTGSTGTGRRIAESIAPRLIRASLELGGKGANIVFPDADLDRAVAGLVTGLTAGTGQACNAGSRILLHRSVRDEVLERLTGALETVVIGDPLDATTEIGPLASRPQYAKVTGYLDAARDEASTSLIYGAKRGTEIPGVQGGLFVQPTVYDTPDRSSRIRSEEIFGPVGAVMTFDDDADALRLANDTEFGLVSGLWTRDIDRARRIAKGLEVGVVWINTWRMFSGNVPFGGRKSSGVGHEMGLDWIEEYTEPKAVWLGPEHQ
jgi:acyl-CoA reductase-like NAD-dependent aldehyde dehydrogenase